MFSSETYPSFDGAFLLRAAAAWFLSACVFLCAASLIANLAGWGERGLAYTSSALSFLTAAAAGCAAAGRRSAGRLSAALLSATMLVILLLTVGFLIRGRAMSPSALLSVVSFSYAGCLVGGVLLNQPAGKRGKSAFRKRH